MRKTQGPRILFIPDTQIAPDEDNSHVEWAAKYAAGKKPDVICSAGDWFDLPSLSSYDEGQRAMEGRRLHDDLNAGNEALDLFDRTLRRYAPRSYKPRKFVTLGNHDMRLQRHIDANPKLDGKLSMNDMEFRRYGWVVYPFLTVAKYYGISFSHFFPLSANGNVTNSRNGAPSALAQVRRFMASCVAGHRQGYDSAIVNTPSGIKRGIIAGSYFQHNESYLTPQGNAFWRGLLTFNDCQPDGTFDVCEISLSWLERRFG